MAGLEFQQVLEDFCSCFTILPPSLLFFPLMCDRMLWWYCCHTLDEMSTLTSPWHQIHLYWIAIRFCACLCSVFLQNLGIPGSELKKPVCIQERSKKKKNYSPLTRKVEPWNFLQCNVFHVQKKRRSLQNWRHGRQDVITVVFSEPSMHVQNVILCAAVRGVFFFPKSRQVGGWPNSNDFHFGLHLFK